MNMPLWRPLVLLISVVIASSYTDFRIRLYPEYAYTTYIPKVIDGTYGAPAIYRVLVPYTNTWLAGVTGWSPATIWHLSRIFWFSTAFVVMYLYLGRWFRPEAALAGVLGVAATLPLTYTNSWAHADSIPELALFTLGCLAAVERRDVLFALVLMVAALNRETAVFLLLIYVLLHGRDRRAWVPILGFAGVFAAVYVGLRAWRGVEHYDYWQLGRNIAFLTPLPPAYDLYKRFFGWFWVLLLAPALLVVTAGRRRVPPDARRLLLAVVPFAAVAVTLSSIIESRIFLPLYPLVLPGLMFALDMPKRVTEGTTCVE
jgi:hypothetical protein